MNDEFWRHVCQDLSAKYRQSADTADAFRDSFVCGKLDPLCDVSTGEHGEKCLTEARRSAALRTSAQSWEGGDIDLIDPSLDRLIEVLLSR